MDNECVTTQEPKRLGRQSLRLANRPRVLGHAATVGKKEGEGPLGALFDVVLSDDTLGEKSWEKAETKMLRNTVLLALRKAMLTNDAVDVFLCGDLLNQIVSAGFAARELGVPFLGQYGACSTMAQSLLLGALLVDGGYSNTVVCASSSHFSTAERQYRFPLELGNQRTPTSQWTVTGAGATVLGEASTNKRSALPIVVEAVTIGKVVDLGQNDENNMGAAMAPAAADTLQTHLRELKREANHYDCIATGDLGAVGANLLRALCQQEGLTLGENYMDCGNAVFGPEQGVCAGGSGCGCSAVVLNGHLLRAMAKGELRRLLFIATGAMLSTTTSQQGESIPGIAHAVSFVYDGERGVR